MDSKNDTGLGLAEFLATPAESPVAEAPKEATPAPAESVEVKTAPEPEKAEVKGQEQEKTSEVETKTAPEAETKIEAPSSTNWEDDTNPYKKRHADASKWANQVHMQNLDMKRQLDIINKKLDGTYDPEAEAKANEIQPEALARTAENVGRITASREAAYQIYGQGDSAKGEQIVSDTLWANNAPFRAIEHLPQVQARVMNSPSPVLEAMKIVDEYAFAQKWGKTPQEIESNIKKAYRKEIEDQVTKDFLEKMKIKDSIPQGISDARSAGPGGATIAQEYTPLSQIFGR